MEKIEPKRITLRPLRASDAEAFMSWGGDPLVTESLFWDHYSDIEAAREFLGRVAEAHPWFKAVCIDGKAVGAVTLNKGKAQAAPRAELGYVISKAHWGRGVATRACELALESGFKDLGVFRIEALVDPENSGSVRVLEKVGFKKEGHFRNYLIHRGKIRDRFMFGAYPK